METVILLHGLYMTGSELVMLRGRLRKHGFRTRIFKYRSVGAGLAENAERLHRFVADSEGPRVHLLGHSLGGVVMLQMLQAYPLDERPGRVLCLGSPLRGSSLAGAFLRLPLGHHLVGRTLQEAGARPELAAWHGGRDLGIIAGSLNLGLGSLLGAVSGPSDGTVSVEETRLPGAADHLVLPVCHVSMLFSTQVADQAAAFLRRGSFSRPQAACA
jgi:pimeloyl-ACP methyl ester carboxylesterase